MGTAITFSGSGSTAPSGQTITGYAWSFGDGGTGTGASPAHTYATAGSFTATLTVTDTSGATGSATATVTISALPVANAGGPYSGNVGTAVSFSGAASTAPSGQTITGYAWSFGDGGTGTGASPTHTYTTAGSFTATLTVTDTSGATGSATATVTISALPVANAGGPYSGNVGTVVTFNGAASTAPTGQTITGYAWSFGDGGTGTGVSPAHTYTTAGSFTATLTVTDTSGTTGSATVMVTISALPVANAGGPYSGNVGTVVTFNGAASTAPTGQTITGYAWSFGDGGTSTGVSPTHTYTTAGSFTATLTVTDTSGATGSATTTVTVSALPVAKAGGPYSSSVGTTITFSGSGSTAPSGQTITGYAWSFGDGGTSTGVSPTHTYTTAGSFTATLTVTDTSGATGSATATVTISALPVANAGGPYSSSVGTTITFSGSGSTAPSGQTITGYAWSFGDGGTSNGVSPTHTYTTAGSFTATLTVTDTSGATGSATATVTISALPVANAGGPYSGNVGTAVSFSGAASTAPSGQTITGYAWSFGDGGTGTGASPTHTYTTAGSFTATLTVTDTSGATGSATATVTISGSPAPLISGFSPASGPVGTVITVTGANLVGQTGSATQVTLSQQGGGTIVAPISTIGAGSLSFVIPSGAATGDITVAVGANTVTTSTALTVTTSSTYTLSVTPTNSTLIQGQSTSLAATISTTNSFSGLANVTVSGVPSGVTATLQPSSIAVGQTSLLTLTAPAGQAVGPINLSFTAVATIDGQTVTKSASATLNVTTATTSFLGRTVVDDAAQEPIAGVTVKMLGVDDKGNVTGCSGQTASDGAGNFLLLNLSAACVGPQLVSYNGATATAPAGVYAGVNLSYTLRSGKVTTSPVLVHLPRVDNAETVQVQQNSPTNQFFYFQTIPGLVVTVYAGTTFTLSDGTMPNPFPLTAIDIPVDRLPDQIATSGMLTTFIVAFQPAMANSSQPVAVTYPNPLNYAPGTSATLATLDPTHGYMVPYGTATVSPDGTMFLPDADPAHTGHQYGLLHFDWHGPMPPPPPSVNPSPDAGFPATPAPKCPVCPDPSASAAAAGRPVDLSSGIVNYTSSDISIRGARGSIAINRYYRTLSNLAGPFGIGTAHDYSYQLNVATYVQGGQNQITLVTPDGNQYVFSKQANGTLINQTVPALRGAVISLTSGLGPFTLRWADGTQYQFVELSGGLEAYLSTITDLNGNTTTLSLNPNQPTQILSITDPVGRTLTLTYDSSNRISQVSDPIGRIVKYTYNSQGTLGSFTDANGGLTSYTYDGSNKLATVTDPRGVVTEQNTYNESFDGRVTQQIEADGGIFGFAYTLLNPGVATSPVIQTVVTDPLGNQTAYRYNPQGFLISVTDASGQIRTLTRDPAHNNLVSAYAGAGKCAVCGDPARGDVSYTFDQSGNTLTQTDALGQVTSFTYDGRFNKAASITDPLGYTTTLTYDSSGNLLNMVDANGHKIQLTYDSLGEVTQAIDPSGSATKLAYDAFSNPNSVTDALGKTSSLSFDGVSRLTKFADPLGRNTTLTYDLLNRLISQTDPKGNTISFKYDGIGNLLSYTDARGNSVGYTYDKVGRPLTQTSALGLSESYTFDVDSNLIQYMDRRGLASTYKYDVLNRLIRETYTDATVSRAYDVNGRVLAVNDSAGGLFGFSYDADGRILTQLEPTGSVSYTRDAVGRVATRQVAGQAQVGYSYDPVGNIISASMTNAGVSYSYNSRNLPLTLTRTNGIVTNYTYDALGQLLSILHTKGSATLNTIGYTYDAAGARTVNNNSISQASVTQAASSTFDKGNELVTNAQVMYTHDANGNRLSEVGGANNLTYVWDGRNRLLSITNASGVKTQFSYDFGRNLIQIRNIVGFATTQQSFVIDDLRNVVSLTNALGSPESVLTGRALDTHYASVDASGTAQFAIGDALGSITGTADATGSLNSTMKYESFGQTTGTAQTAYPFAYTGRVPVVGSIYYYRSRYYDTLAGRFLSEDPLGVAAGINRYSYADNDPVSYSDPLGLDAQSANSGDDPDLTNQIGAIKCIGIGEGLGAEFALQLVKAEMSVTQALTNFWDYRNYLKNLFHGKEDAGPFFDKTKDAGDAVDQAYQDLRDVQDQAAGLSAFKAKCSCHQ